MADLRPAAAHVKSGKVNFTKNAAQIPSGEGNALLEASDNERVEEIAHDVVTVATSDPTLAPDMQRLRLRRATDATPHFNRYFSSFSLRGPPLST